MRFAFVLLFIGAAARAGEVEWVHAGAPARSSCAGAQAGWEQPGFDDSAWSEWTPPPPDAGMRMPPDAGAVDGGVACTTTRYSRWRFDVGPELGRLATVTLRIRYAHGL